nr:hypothetical protein [Tanacetum cinerariifolium]
MKPTRNLYPKAIMRLPFQPLHPRSNYGPRDDDALYSGTAYSMSICSMLETLKIDEIGSILLHVMKCLEGTEWYSNLHCNEELLDNYSLSLPIIESYHFDIPSFSRPLAKPTDANTGILNIKMMGDISEQKAHMPGLMITHVSNQEKSLDLLSHRSLKTFQPSAKCLMMIHGNNIPILDVPLFYFYPLDQFKYGRIGSSSAT